MKRKRVNVADLRSFVLAMPAFANDSKHDQDNHLCKSMKEKLKQATTINEIFDLIDETCASFFHYEIFDSIKNEYCTTQLDHEKSKLNYVDHFKKYVELIKISEFFYINPKLKEKYSDSETIEITFKVGKINMSSKISAALDLRDAIATNLKIMPTTLKLVSIEEGCLIVTFLIPTVVAEIIFANDNKLNSEQIERFQSLSIFWLKCGNFTQKFLPDHQDTLISQIPNSGEMHYIYIAFQCVQNYSCL